MLEDPWQESPEDIYALTRSPQTCPNEPAYVEVEFERGVPVRANGIEMPLIELIESVETIAGAHGVGRIDMVENATTGVKSREIYEAPAAVVLHTAHSELEKLVIPRDLERLAHDLGRAYADLAYNGRWFSPTREAIDAFMATIQPRVTGAVRLKLFKGDCRVVGRRSPMALDDNGVQVDLPTPARRWCTDGASLVRTVRGRSRRRALRVRIVLSFRPPAVRRRRAGEPGLGGRTGARRRPLRGRRRGHRAGPRADSAEGRWTIPASSRRTTATRTSTRSSSASSSRASATPARRLHTGRSRNEQVAVDLRLYLKRRIPDDPARHRGTIARFVELADRAGDALMPSYTHLRRAQPVLVSHFLLSHCAALRRDVDRLAAVLREADELPLGSGAIAGTSYAIDVHGLAAALGFGRIARNSIDVSGDRDFVASFLHAASLGMVHLSRIAEDFILFTSEEFGFFELADAAATGSSLMPQKKNPDPLELVRGKSGRVIGHLTGWLVTMKGLPAGYNKDLQEDKEALFDAEDTWIGCLRAVSSVVGGLTPNAAAIDARGVGPAARDRRRRLPGREGAAVPRRARGRRRARAAPARRGTRLRRAQPRRVARALAALRRGRAAGRHAARVGREEADAAVDRPEGGRRGAGGDQDVARICRISRLD